MYLKVCLNLPNIPYTPDLKLPQTPDPDPESQVIDRLNFNKIKLERMNFPDNLPQMDAQNGHTHLHQKGTELRQKLTIF